MQRVKEKDKGKRRKTQDLYPFTFFLHLLCPFVPKAVDIRQSRLTPSSAV
jgi:hypothetical protein